MDDNNIFVLLIQNDATETGLIRRALARHGDGVFKLQCVDSTPTALARIGGGGIDVIMLDLSLHSDRSVDGLASFLQIHEAAPEVPVIVLYDAHDEGLALRAMRAGAADYMLKEGCSEGMSLVIRSAIELGRKQFDSRNSSGAMSRQIGGVVSFIGAKGGVGTTTVALNVASALAKRSRVILAEIWPGFGTLVPYLKPYGQIRNISHLLRVPVEVGPAEAAAGLWPCKNVPGLNILFGPQLASECGDLAADRVKKLIRALAGLADYVVLDLPSCLSDANRAAAEVSGRLVLVLERDPVCVQSARLMARSIEAWDGAPHPIEFALVNRASLSSPMPLAEIETQLGFPTLGVIPPGPDVCLGAQHARAPVIAFQPDSLVADSLNALAEKCASFMRSVPMVA